MSGLRLSIRGLARALSFESIFGHDLTREDEGYRGRNITAERARQSLAVYACQSLISGDVANLPWGPFRKRGDARIPLLPEPSWVETPNPLNPNYTEISYKRQVALSLLQDGNAFIAVYPDIFAPTQLLVLNPTQVEVKGGDNGPVYVVHGPGLEGFGFGKTLAELTPFQCVHIPFVLPPGESRGVNPIQAAAQAINIDLSAQQQGAKFLDGGGLVTGVIEVPREAGELTDKQKDDLRESFKRKREGPRGYSIGVLDGGAAFKQMTMTQQDAQYIETRKYGLEEIARLYLIPPFMVGSQEASGVAYASSVERAQHYIDHCLAHYTGPIEVGHKRLLGGRGTYMKFNFNGLLRGSPKERAEFYDSGLQNKWLFLEDVARWEELDPNREGTYLETPNNNGPREAAPAPAGAPQRALGTIEVQPNVTVNVPELQPSFTVKVPEQPTPNVTYTVNVPEQKPPTVNVRATPAVTVTTPDRIAITEMPTRATTRRVTNRDRDGRIAETQDIETDLGG